MDNLDRWSLNREAIEPPKELSDLLLFGGDECDPDRCGSPCCIIPAICSRQLVKPRSRKCRHLESNRCKVFGTEDRPQDCGSFYCNDRQARWMMPFLQEAAIKFHQGY